MQETDIIEHTTIPGAQAPFTFLVKLLEDKLQQTTDKWIQCSLPSLFAVASPFKKKKKTKTKTPPLLELKLQKWKCGSYPLDFHYGQY